MAELLANSVFHRLLEVSFQEQKVEFPGGSRVPVTPSDLPRPSWLTSGLCTDVQVAGAIGHQVVLREGGRSLQVHVLQRGVEELASQDKAGKSSLVNGLVTVSVDIITGLCKKLVAVSLGGAVQSPWLGTQALPWFFLNYLLSLTSWRFVRLTAFLGRSSAFASLCCLLTLLENLTGPTPRPAPPLSST